MAAPQQTSFYAQTGPTYDGVNPASSSNNGEICIVIDGAGSVISTGVKADFPITFGCIINSMTLVADQAGNIVIDIWKAPLAGFPPTIANTITAADLPTLSGANSIQDTTLTGWTTAINPGDVLRFNVNSAATLTRVTLTLQITKG